MTLILSDLFKDINYIAFSIVTFVRGKNVPNNSPYCQASGFMIQFGTEVTGKLDSTREEIVCKADTSPQTSVSY